MVHFDESSSGREFVAAVRPLLLLVSIVGTLLFGSAFLTSLAQPGYVEDVAKNLIRHEVEKKVHEKIDALDEKFLAGKAGALIQKHAQEAEQARRQLREKVPERIAAEIAEMRNLDCECRRKIESHSRAGLEWTIAKAAQAKERLTALIRSQYMEVATRLTREFRIFTGANALVFSLLGGAVWFKRGAGRHLVPAALVLVAAAVATGYLYLFQQNWLRTVLFSDYVGWAYFAYLGAVFALLGDVVLNRARATVGLLRSVSFDIQVLPC